MLNYVYISFINLIITPSLDTQFVVNTTSVELYSSLMLQFGLLVFVLSLISLSVPNLLGLYGAFMLTITPLFFTWFYSLLTLHAIYVTSDIIYLNLFRWFSLPGAFTVSFEVLIDKLSITYTCLVLSIGLCVLVYTFSYFRYEPHVERLFLFINLFMISMCILVLGGNLFVLFLGWELIGLTSFFLINFWSTKISTLKSAFKAFVFNKISDLGLLIFIMLNLLSFGDVNILTLNNLYFNIIDYTVNVLGIHISYLEILSFFIMLSAFIKSAQFGFHIWLPDSMEAPVPASALIHSATLVSAGVFLLLRFSFLIELTTSTLYWILIISSITASLGGIGACFQSDAKRILAYSTISHCGFLVFLSCCFNLEVVLLYLCVHGFFKALVFMCVGNIIRFSRNYQDFRFMGGFSKFLPFETSLTLVGLLNLGGLPFSFGFFIKHYTLITLFDYTNFFIKLNLLIGMFSGLIYSYRLYYYVFFDSKKAKKAVYVSSSTTNLKSQYYSNTTLASSCAIVSLLVISIAIITYMYMSFFSVFLDNTANSSWSFNSKTYFVIQTVVENANIISFYINMFILILTLTICTLKFRYQIMYHTLLGKLFILYIFSVFFYIVMLIV